MGLQRMEDERRARIVRAVERRLTHNDREVGMDREPDFVALTVRRLTPGAYDAWRKAWHDPDDPDGLWVDQESKAYIVRNVADPDEIVAFGFFHGGRAELLALRDEPETQRRQAKRAAAMSSPRRGDPRRWELRGARGRHPRGGPPARASTVGSGGETTSSGRSHPTRAQLLPSTSTVTFDSLTGVGIAPARVFRRFGGDPARSARS